MKTIQQHTCAWRLAALATVIATGGALMPATASANTASNTTLRNTVTVNYADAGGTAQLPETDEVDVVVQLVEATPTLNAPDDQYIVPTATAVYAYTVYSNANGPDTYNITVSAPTESAGLSGSTAVLTTASVTLGATTVATAPGAIAANTPTAIVVPSDAASDAAVNGIASGEVVVIGGVRCDVTAITDSGTPGTGAISNSSITVDCDAGISPAYGAVIGEQQSFSMTVDPNGWTGTSGPTETVDVTVSAQDDASAQSADTDDTTTFVEQLLSVTKYVRNVTTGAVGVGPVVVGGATYYASGIVGVPTNTLEYLVEVTNLSGSNSATDVVISDPVPAFTTFSATDFAVLDDTGAVVGTCTATANNGDQCEVVGTTVYMYPGDAVGTIGDDTDGGTGNVNGDGGTVGAGNNAYGRFRVTID